MTWKCPNCGREFSRQNQDHYCGKPQTVEEYIASQEESLRPRLEQLRSIIHEAIPDAEEKMAWAMPTFRKGRNLIHFAAFKKHIGLYPGEEAVAALAEELSGYRVSKGTVRIPHDQPLPEELIGRIAKWCYEKYAGQDRKEAGDPDRTE